MARHVPIRLAGMIAATTTLTALAALAANANAQTATLCDPLDGSQCTSTQVQNADVTGLVNLDVSVEQLQVSNSAIGNMLSGGIQDTSGAMASQQTLRGSAVAETELVLNGQAERPLSSSTQARGNYFGATTENATFEVDASQRAVGDNVRAQTNVQSPTGFLLQGGSVATLAAANTVALGGPSSTITGTVDQVSNTGVFAATVADVQYVPAPVDFSAQAVGNLTQSVTTGTSHQDLVVRQTSRPSQVEAQADIYVDNTWNLSARSEAIANQTSIQNTGGSLLVETDQTNQSQVISYTRTQTNLQGETVVSSRAVGNETDVSNLDIYLRLDNNQLNSGGVEATTAYNSVNGYDSYIGSSAAGNSVTAYGCANCGAEVNVNNTQVNNGAVTSTTNATIGTGRTAVVGSTAVGNTATFYVTRPGSGG